MPTDVLYIFPRELPKTFEKDKAEIGQSVEGRLQYTFKMKSMAPAKATSGGEVRIVDSRNFPVSKHIAAGLVTIKPGGMRELHWHPTSSEWRFYIAGKRRMTVFTPVGNARTMDYNANDVGYVPAVAGHYVENTGDTDLVFLEIFKAEEFQDVTLNNWIRRLPTQMVQSHLNLTPDAIHKIPAEKQEVIAT